MAEAPPTEPLKFITRSEEEMIERAGRFSELMATRRSVREFSGRDVPKAIIEACLRTAGSSPSGANRQPWHFAVVGERGVKKEIRELAEVEEREFYSRRAPGDWLEALAPLGTDASKPFLEEAPWLIVIFAQKFAVDDQGRKQKNYYVTESVGIATGLLIAALHNAGLATLTHTPSPMKFLNRILDRPDTEKPLLILVAGYPEEGTRVPAISRKALSEICSFYD